MKSPRSDAKTRGSAPAADRASHRLLGRVLILVLLVVTAEGAVTAVNTLRINADQAARNRRIDSEICRVLAKIPGDVNLLERDIGCPITPEHLLPTRTRTIITTGPTVTVRPPSSVPPAGTTHTVPSGPHTAGGTAPLPTPTPSRTAGPRPTPTPPPAPSPGPSCLLGLVCLNEL